MAQLLKNPAKTVYMRFDGLALAMANTSSVKKEVKGKGLLKRINQKVSKDDMGSEKQEPLEVALDYFIAIRQQRDKLKQES